MTYCLQDIDQSGAIVNELIATDEQSAIIDAALHTTDSILISALAGSAKTTTLEFICHYLPSQPILCLAFNKKIAEEMAVRLPSFVTCRTMNSIGHRIWSTACGKKLFLNVRKNYETLKEIVEGLAKDQRLEAYESFSETLKAIAQAKRDGYIPAGKYPTAKPLASREEFHSGLEEPPTSLQSSLIDATLTTSIRQAYAGTIDFDDQIYMPTLFGGTFPRFQLVLVDEYQDLSSINHAMLRKLVTRRLIAVGDPWQSIYGFRGATFGGMAAGKDMFNMRELPLSVSFRCPEAIVKAARSRVPHMQWRKPGGHYSILPRLHGQDIPDGSAILCRSNAPLFHLALLLLGMGRGVHLVGTDLGPALVKTLKKLGPETLKKDQVHAAIDTWERERLLKTRDKASASDRAECLRVFAEFGDTLGGAIAYCEHLFSGRGAIQLLSGHKAKGLEWDTVYHLDPWRIPSPYAETEEELEQEANLRYVITTRAKETLFEIDSANIIMEALSGVT